MRHLQNSFHFGHRPPGHRPPCPDKSRRREHRQADSSRNLQAARAASSRQGCRRSTKGRPSATGRRRALHGGQQGRRRITWQVSLQTAATLRQGGRYIRRRAPQHRTRILRKISSCLNRPKGGRESARYPKTHQFLGLPDAGYGGRRSTSAFRSCILRNLKKRAQHPPECSPARIRL